MQVELRAYCRMCRLILRQRVLVYRFPGKTTDTLQLADCLTLARVVIGLSAGSLYSTNQ